MSDKGSVKILVVDDSATIRKTAETILSKEGYHVELAQDGFQGLVSIAASRPNVIFLDIMMPRLDGYQVCSIVKSNPDFAQIPIIMLSSKDSIFDKARGRLSGSEYFMTKPFSRDELIQTLKEHVLKEAGK